MNYNEYSEDVRHQHCSSQIQRNSDVFQWKLRNKRITKCVRTLLPTHFIYWKITQQIIAIKSKK